MSDTVVAAVRARHRELGRVLADCDRERLLAPSGLPGWSRLTVVCHLRYGAEATLALTEAVLAGRAAAYYPEGRAAQREATLRPRPGEDPAVVVASLTASSTALDDRFGHLAAADWERVLREPIGREDLGPVPLSRLAELRLTEVEVHGTDLDLDLSAWSDVFVTTALPQRLRWLTTRRSNHRPSDRSIEATWLLIATDGGRFMIRAAGDRVLVEPVSHSGLSARVPIDATITGTGRELLGFILGRAPLERLRVGGDHAVAAAFLAAFPPP